jgi:transcriptional regulator with XRE-family HTH domain
MSDDDDPNRVIEWHGARPDEAPDIETPGEEWPGAALPYEGNSIPAQIYRDDGDEPLYAEPDEGDEILAEFERTKAAWQRLGYNLGRARERMGLSKREAARRAGLSDGAWRHLESGVKVVYGRTVLPNPRPENLVAAAKAVGLPPSKVFAIVGRKPPAGAVEPTSEDQLAAEIRALRPEDRETVERLVYRLSQD